MSTARYLNAEFTAHGKRQEMAFRAAILLVDVARDLRIDATRLTRHASSGQLPILNRAMQSRYYAAELLKDAGAILRQGEAHLSQTRRVRNRLDAEVEKQSRDGSTSR